MNLDASPGSGTEISTTSRVRSDFFFFRFHRWRARVSYDRGSILWQLNIYIYKYI